MKPSEYLAEGNRLDLSNFSDKNVREVAMVVTFLDWVEKDTDASLLDEEDPQAFWEMMREAVMESPVDTMELLIKRGGEGVSDIALDGLKYTLKVVRDELESQGRLHQIK